MIYNQASGVVNNNSMSEVDISSFNQKFTQYEGTNVRGAQVNSLLNQIQNNNVTYSNDASRQVSVVIDSTAEWGGTNKPNGAITSGGYDKAQTGKTYKVTCTTDSSTGLVTTVTISKAS